MPRPKAPETARRSEYNEFHIRELLTGFSGLGEQFKVDVEKRQAWQQLKGELLPAWITRHPGSRPAAWWLFDAPERRQRIDGKPHPFDNPERIAAVKAWRAKYSDVANREAEKMFFGLPTCGIVEDDSLAIYETELAYLDRLNLLTDAERKAIAAPDYETPCDCGGELVESGVRGD